jgi:hypothetical protein
MVPPEESALMVADAALPQPYYAKGRGFRTGLLYKGDAVLLT